MLSVWSATEKVENRRALNQDMKTDVLIIGGGMAGILCAYRLEQENVPYILVEAEDICGGITKNTTAKITYHHGWIFDTLIRRFGIEKALMYLEANKSALDEFRNLCNNIDCDFEEKDSYVYSVDNRKKIEKEIIALEKLGRAPEFIKDTSLPFSVAGAVKIKNQAQFHPLKFAAAIAPQLNIYENTRVVELTDEGAVTEKGTIKAEKIIVATHFPFINKHGSYFLKQYQHRSYVIALENAPQVNGMYVDENQKGMSFRNYKDLLFLGGGDHRTGKKGGNWRELADFGFRHYREAREAYRWATQDCMTLDGVPYIGQYSKNTPNFYVATGFQKWGMTSSMVSATILSDMILGKENSHAEVFSPSRTILRPQLALNAVAAVTNLLTPSTKRCPHMGCALKWNKHERSWDCPCHGSRFTEDGKLIDNPATGNLPMN